MQDNDRAQFGAMLAAVSQVYGRDLSPGVTAIYWQALRGYELAAVRRAFDRHVKNPDSGQFWPKPADLIRMLDGSTQDAAAVAWAKVVGAIRRVGGYVDVAFDDALIHRIVEEMGGWAKLCDTPEAELPFRMQDFVRLYRGYAGRGECPPYPARLFGRFTVKNFALGVTETELVLVGDAAAARAVVEGGAAGGASLSISKPDLIGLADLARLSH